MIKVEEVVYEKQPTSYTRPRPKRCCRKIKRWSGAPNQRCGRFVTHTLNGVGFCKQHAGEAALNYLISEGEKCQKN